LAKIISNVQHQEPVPDIPTDRLPKNLAETKDIENLHYRVEEKGKKNISKQDRSLLLEIALRHTPKNHSAIDIPKDLERRILSARRLFQKEIQRQGSEELATCHMSSYIAKQTILTNILFGKVKNQTDETKQKIRSLVHQIMIEKEFIEEIIAMGLKHGVGSKGENLSGGQRQKLAIARVLLKDPPIIIMDEATSSLDNESQHRIQSFLENNLKEKRTVIWIAHRLDTIQNFDKIAVMQQGKIVELDTYSELIKNKNGTLYRLIKGNAKE
jgi:ABC-type glutathione transport system ATPase component